MNKSSSSVSMPGKPAYALFFLTLFISVFLPVFLRSLVAAEKKVNCLTCHKQLAKGKFVHQALAMGCPTCHGGINGRTFPHKKTNALAKGLSSEQPELCYGCHDPGMFSKKNVHPAVGMGCTSCHNPHSSKNAKLLKSKPPSLCFTCHDKTGFTKKTVHPPVAAGECLTCHAPHATDEMALLLNKPVEVCLMCHAGVSHWPHFSLGTAQEKERPDPVRPGKPFYCGSCHNPHSADGPALLKFKAQSSREFCTHCHMKD
jgi:predicted CXXCH cytochrome family protein